MSVRTIASLGLPLLGAVAISLAASQIVLAQPKSAKQATNMQGVSQAALAARLAFEGEKRQSPVLLLAAAELLDDLTQAPTPDGIKNSLPQAAAPSPFDAHRLVTKAGELAGQDPQVAALVKKRAESLRQRGVPAEAIGDAPTTEVEGVKFVLLGSGQVDAEAIGRMDNIPFVGAEPAIVIAVSEAPNALQMGVFDMASGMSVADVQMVDPTILAAAWEPEETSAHAVLVKNRTKSPTQVVVLANVSEGGEGGGGGGVPAPPAPFRAR